MASKKELIDAQTFSRRRLLTAFTSGAPGGKELEPASTLRAVIAGVVLTIMVIVGGIFYGIIRPGLPDGWEDNNLILVSDTGARYFSSNGVLYPVANATSARLIIPSDKFKVVTTDSKTVSQIPIAGTIGILGAPDDVPKADGLVGDDWTACVAGPGVSLTIPGHPDVSSTPSGVLVSNGGELYVIDDERRYFVASEGADAVLRAVGLGSATPVPVDSRWLNLFEEGSDLAPLVVPKAGDELTGIPYVVGAVVQPQGTENRFLITTEGSLASLTPLAYQLYLLGTGSLLGGERVVAPGDIASLPNSAEVAGADDWPDEALEPLSASTAPCAILRHRLDGVQVTQLGASSSAPGAPGTTVGVRQGALVFAGGSGAESVRSLVLVDESAKAFPIPYADDELLARLGYTPDDVANVNSTWMQFFAYGPELTIEAALSSPSADGLGHTVVELPAEPTPAATDGTTDGGDGSGAASVDAVMAGVTSVDAGDTCEAGNFIYEPQSPPALSMLQSTDVWTRATGLGITVAVVDSGIDTSNPHLAGTVIGGVNFVNDGERADGQSDPLGHGTAVAGLIASQKIDNSGVVGLAPDAKLLAVRVFRSNSNDDVRNGFGPTSGRVAQGIRWAADNGADIINVSMSLESDEPDVRAAVAYAASKNILVVASAGNRATSATGVDAPRYPAAYPQALAVSAANDAGIVNDDSIHGPHVEAAAPGTNILTAQSGGADCWFAIDAASSSYATGYASAAAALVAQAHPDETYSQWEYRLTASATRTSPDSRNDRAGWGVIQPFDAIAMIPGGEQRGPDNPFGASGTVPIVTSSISLDPQYVESPLVETRGLMVMAVVFAIVLLGALGVFVSYRQQSEPAPERVPNRPGILDERHDDTTRILYS